MCIKFGMAGGKWDIGYNTRVSKVLLSMIHRQLAVCACVNAKRERLVSWSRPRVGGQLRTMFANRCAFVRKCAQSPLANRRFARRGFEAARWCDRARPRTPAHGNDTQERQLQCEENAYKRDQTRQREQSSGARMPGRRGPTDGDQNTRAWPRRAHSIDETWCCRTTEIGRGAKAKKGK